ncbi:hypothetical protein [Salinarimonas ramus]|uniref:Uncharacterized protein n=1 Tax=Salinarimonas ramus TaxID=690164 RepID=A0A917V3P7_9HYPH|nr:hypothetical protein [Salinarimonas ramus]GGK35326.1 hypothetical protein GCM10011322_22700 [Salinarimonas ramus]
MSGVHDLLPTRLAHRLMVATLALLVVCAGAGAASAQSLLARWVDRDGAELASRSVDLDVLEGLDGRTIETSTPWTEGVTRFDGPRLSAIAALEPGALVEARLTALNDYAISIPAEDIVAHEPILASRLAGERMRVRDRGPLWLVHDLDSDPALQTQRYHAQMIWQVRDVVFVVDTP